LPTHKPDPQGLAALLDRLGLQPAEALYMGDAEVDVQGGSALGVETLYISHRRPLGATVATLARLVVDLPGEAYALVSARIAGTVAK
jgi:phosphoglycolate phosphatase-like HAD superfamily hydrolase